MATASIFQTRDFDLLSDGVYSQELSHLQHTLGITSIGRVITIKCTPDRHFRLDRVDRSPGGEIGGWWYEEIGGTGKVLIIND